MSGSANPRGVRILLALLCAALPVFAGGDLPFVCVSTVGADTPTCGTPQPGNPPSCTTPSSACLSIQYAYLNRVTANGEIRVLPGTYFGCTDASAFAFDPASVKPVSIRANAWVAGADNTATTLQAGATCNGASSDPRPVVTLGGNGAAIEGFTISDGGEGGVVGLGGVAITNNMITGNSASSGAGIYAYTYNCYYGDTTTTISGNDIQFNAAAGNDGGGVYVLARGTVEDAACFAGNSTVTVDSNLVANNFLDGNFGGGISVFSDTFAGASAHVAVTSNDIIANTMNLALGGFGGGLWASTYGFGSELIEITGNSVLYNQAGGDGGGVSAWVNSAGSGPHRVLVEDNDVSFNTAEANGGGLDLFMLVQDLAGPSHATLEALVNRVEGNDAATTGSLSVGGGGILATVSTVRTDEGQTSFSIAGNEILDNSSRFRGGGMSIFAVADADADDAGQNPPPSPTTASVTTSNNMIVANQTTDGATSSQGGGVFALLQSFGDATASASVELSTIADNTANTGPGGIEVESFTGVNVFGTVNPGQARFLIDRSIVAGNTGFAVGGPRPGTGGIFPGGLGAIYVDVTHNDLFDNPSGNFESTLQQGTSPPSPPPALRPADNVATDPLFTASYDHGLCRRLGSGRLLGRFFEDPGSTDGLSSSLPDIDFDELSSGVDVLRIALAFGAATDSPRFTALSDLDGNGIVDGTDLALLIAAIDVNASCP